MIKLQDARIADGLPRVVAEQPWAKVLSAVYGELQGRDAGISGNGHDVLGCG